MFPALNTGITELNELMVKLDIFGPPYWYPPTRMHDMDLYIEGVYATIGHLTDQMIDRLEKGSANSWSSSTDTNTSNELSCILSRTKLPIQVIFTCP